ncbi:MAG: PAS domain S-box protein [Actinomycetales bacterium]|nr:PAS domain S-box protein [Actinomycetales bacterium]
MRAPSHPALEILVRELHADGAVLIRRDTPGSACVSDATVPTIAEGDPWPNLPEIDDAQLITDPSRFGRYTSTAMRLSLPSELRGVLIAPLAEGRLALLVAWAQSRPPEDETALTSSGTFATFAALAPLLDTQRQYELSNARLRALLGAMSQAVVLVDGSGGPGEINRAAGGLLGLPAGAVSATELSGALRALRERALHGDVDETPSATLIENSSAHATWVCNFEDEPRSVRVSIAPIPSMVPGSRVWVFDDISRERALLNAERDARDAVAVSEQRYRMLVENAADIVFQSVEGILEWISPNLESVTGWRPADLVGTSTIHLWHPDDMKEAYGLRERVYDGGEGSGVMRFRKADGTYLWIEVSLSSYVNPDGLRGAVGIMRDVSARVAAEEQARRSEARYRLLAENASDVVFEKDPDAVIRWASPSAREFLGVEPDDLIGRPIATVFVPEDVSRVESAHRLAETGRNVTYRARFVRADGDIRWSEVSARPVFGADGLLIGRIGSLRDIHEEVLAEEALAEVQARYRFVAENASDVVTRYSPDGVIEWAFGSTQDLLGIPPDGVVGIRTTDWLSDEDMVDFDEKVAALRRGEVVTGYVRLKRPDGGTHWIDRRTRAVFDANGRMQYVVSAWRDAQAVIEYREALTRSERDARELAQRYEAARNDAMQASHAKTAFLSRMSHELRTPLNAVIGFAQLLALDPLTDEQLEAVDQIQTGGRHLLDLVNEILDISRIEAGRMSLSMESVAIKDVVGEALDLVRPMTAATGVTLDGSRGTATTLHALADRQRLIQALINLLTNAVKYNRPGGTVSVSARTGNDGMVHLTVTDTGMGIAPELMPRLFEPFDRLGAESSGIEGTGIGLTLVQGLLSAMGGAVEVESNVGEGSAFSLVLAPAEREHLNDTDVVPSPHSPSLRPPRVLYVEDNPANATLMRQIMRQRPEAELTVSMTGIEGLSLAREGEYDVLFLDLHLPDLGGAEILRELRSDPATTALPIFVLTADASPEVRRQALSMGATGFLTKPVDVAEVLESVDESTREEAAP